MDELRYVHSNKYIQLLGYKYENKNSTTIIINN